MACLVENKVIRKVREKCKEIQLDNTVGRKLFEFTKKIARHDTFVKTSVAGYNFGDS